VVAKLHHERIAGAAPVAWAMVTHGIYGAGANWRSIAKQVVAHRPDWGCILVDLRQHGRSEPGEPPHTLAACAGDVVALADSMDVPVRALVGHSFGGKVMLAARSALADVQTVVMDASPSAGMREGNGAEAVLRLMESLPVTWPSRDAFIETVVAGGQRRPLAQWLATNVIPVDGAYALRLDLPAVRAMLTDYFATDLWADALDPAYGPLAFVVATRSNTIDDADRARLGAAPSHLRVVEVDATHWLHVDAPAAVTSALTDVLQPTA
jgi:esterase